MTYFRNTPCCSIIRTNHLSESPLVLISSDNRRSTVMYQILGSFNLPSRSTSTSTSANTVRSDFADAVADASAAGVECKECKYASKSDTDAGLLPLESAFASAIALSLEVL